MTEKIFFAKDWQARAMQEKRLRQIRMPVKGIPPGASLIGSFPDCSLFSLYETPGGVIAQRAYPPYDVGDVLAVKEAWALAGCFHQYTGGDIKRIHEEEKQRPNRGTNPIIKLPSVYYKAGPTDEILEIAPSLKGRWRSPVTMPRWAVRFRLRVNGVRVVWLHDRLHEDCTTSGLIGLQRDICLSERIERWDEDWSPKGYAYEEAGKGWSGYVWVFDVELMGHPKFDDMEAFKQMAEVG